MAVGNGELRTIDLDEDDAASYRGSAIIPAAAGREEEAAWASREAEAVDRLLERVGDRFAASFMAGTPDRDAVRSRHPRIVPELIPNGVQIPDDPRRDDDGATLIFVGSFGYAPNVDAMLWFAEDIWPRIRRSGAHSVRLRIVGRNIPPAVSALGQYPGIEIVGEVDDVALVYSTATLAIAPLRSGAGTRIKLIEAAAYGVPTVATSLAAGGLAFSAPESLWVADTATEFAEAVCKALADPAERRRRAVRARAVAAENYDRVRLVDQIACRFRELLAK